MSTRCSLRIGLVAAMSLALPAGSSRALAQGVGNLGSLPTQFSSPTSPVVGWSVDSGNAANAWLPVQISPTGPQWIKTFTGPNGGNFTATPGQTFTLQELFVIAPPLSWTDWHEHILTPGWNWIAPTVFLADVVPPALSPPPGLTTVVTPGTLATGGAVDFTFNPLAPGTHIDIRKVLQYTGVNGVAFIGTIQIAEYPTPEPATVGLLSLGGLVLLRRRGVRRPR